MMQIDILTIFPEFFHSPLSLSILGRAVQAGIVDVTCHDLRDYTTDRHHTIDDTPYGGGPGMVMKPEPFFRAVEAIAGDRPNRVIYLTPQGEQLTQSRVRQLAAQDHLIVLCGRYEGIDERVRRALVTDELSIGDFVLSGGETAALALIEAVVRLLPGALGNERSPCDDSFSSGLLEYPQYTRPRRFRDMTVPGELLEGDHARVARWRRKQALRRTYERRPDLLADANLSEDDYRLLAEIKSETE